MTATGDRRRPAVALALGLAALGLTASGCSDSPTASGASREVLVGYRSPLAGDPPPTDDPACGHHYGPLHLNLLTSWNGFDNVRLTETGPGAAEGVVRVPVGAEVGIYVIDVTLCGLDPGGEPATVRFLSIAGTPLERFGVLAGREVALFTLQRDGSVL